MSEDKSNRTEASKILEPLRMVLVEIDGETIYFPLCAVCREPIFDFEMGSIIPRETTARPPQMIESVQNRLEMTAVHKYCDPGGTYPWDELTTVIKTDQRYPFEKG